MKIKKYAIICSLNYVALLMLIIFVFKDNVPILSNPITNKVLLANKWFSIITCLIPIAILMIFKNKTETKYFKFLFKTSFYEELLFFISALYFQNENIISISLSLFMPLSIATIIYALSLPKIKFKSKAGLKIKNIQKNDFIWIQTNLFAKNILGASGLFLFIFSIFFAIFEYFYIEIAVFCLIYLINFITLQIFVNKRYEKYKDLVKRKEMADKQKNIKQN